MQAAPRAAAARARPLVPGCSLARGWPSAPAPGAPVVPALGPSAVPAFGDPRPVMTVLPYGADTAATLRAPADRSQNAFGADLILPAPRGGGRRRPSREAARGGG